MPLPLAAIIPAVAAIIGAAIHTRGAKKRDQKNAETQYRINAQNLRYSQEAAQQERQWSLEDWNREAAYNSPQEQMNRLRQAGLNPHLVYGKGADNTMSSVRGTNIDIPNAIAPKQEGNYGEGFNQGMQNYFSIRQQQAQTDSINQGIALSKDQQLLTQSQTAKNLQDTARSEFELQQAKELKEYVIEQARLNNLVVKQNMSIANDRNLREKLANDANVDLTLNRIKESMLAQANNPLQRKKIALEIQQLEQNVLKEKMDNMLREHGIQPNDPAYMRIITRGYNWFKEQGSISKAMGKVRSYMLGIKPKK